MKTSTLLISSLFLLGSATVTYAGPGAQYWQQRRNPPATAQKASVQKAAAAEKEAVPAKAGSACEKANANKDCTSCGAKS